MKRQRWEPPLTNLARLLRPETRLIVVNFPHSPTGFVPDRAYLERLIALADDAGALLISDEIYRGLPLDASAEPPSVVDLSARAVALNSVSKTYGLPGLRVGWLATRNAAVRDAVRAFRMHLNTYIGAPVEFLAALAVRQSDHIHATNRARARTNLALLDAFLAATCRSVHLGAAARRRGRIPALAGRRIHHRPQRPPPARRLGSCSRRAPISRAVSAMSASASAPTRFPAGLALLDEALDSRDS